MIAQRKVPFRLETVTAETFRARVLEGSGPIAVEFMSYGCAHCRVLEPILQSVAQKLDGREKVYRVNVAVEQDLAAEYAIEGTPTLVMFLDAREVGRVAGPHPTLPSVMTAVTRPFETEAAGVASSA